MKTIRKFKHINAKTIENAVSALQQYGGKARVLAGGTDLLGTMRFDIFHDYPEAVINLKTIPGLDYIREEDGILKIGALTRLEDIANNSTIRSKYAVLSEAASRTASPHIRAMGTISGNLCQLNRCWYFRKEENRFDCLLKGGGMCNAIVGDNRYHSIFGITRIEHTPCTDGCPANIDIPTYMSLIRKGKLTEAAQIILEANPLPAITGRVCPHYCESKCNREYFDESVSIRCIERFMGDYILENPGIIDQMMRTGTKKTIAVIGSGPAGLAAAFYLRKIGYEVTIYENMARPGGLLTYGIPSFRLTKDVVNKQIEAFQKMGIQLQLNTKVGKDIKIDKLTRNYDAVFLACGAWKERSSGIKGAQLIISGVEFLRNSNIGKRKIPGTKVAVMGGGNAAIDVARTLLRLKADPVIIYRRSRAEMPALKEEVEKAEEEGIKIQFLTLPIEASKKDGKIALKCTKMKLGPPDESGRPQPEPIKDSEFTSEFDAVIEAYGEEPDYSIVPREFLDEKGHLKANTATYSLGANIFAGGDFVSGPSTVVEAITAGREAADRIDQYLSGKEKPSKEKGSPGQNSPEKFNSLCLEKSKRITALELSVNQRIRSLDVEDTSGVDKSAVEAEANRCFNCGCIAVNPSDMAPALIVLNAKIVTYRRTINAEEFWVAHEIIKSTMLKNDEIITEIQIPEPPAGVKSAFVKFALRKSIDFPIVNCAAAIEIEGGVVKHARICLNSVYSQPRRVIKAESFIEGKSINEANAETASNAAVTDCIALPYNKYKIQIARAMVKRAILACK